MAYEVIKIYMYIKGNTGRCELKFDHVPTTKEIEIAYNKVMKPDPEPIACPMGNPECPLNKSTVKRVR